MNDPREGSSDSEDPPIDAPEPSAPPQPAAPPAQAPAASTGRSLGIVLGFFALLVAFAAAGGAAFTWWQLNQQRAVVVGEQAEVGDELADMRQLVRAAEERLAAQEQRLRALDSESEDRRRRIEDLDAELRQARARLESLSQEEEPGRSPSMAEVEFLLLLAGRELTLADNPRVALAALREADQRLARLEGPGLARVRAAINDEIAAVEAVAATDLEGTALRLASLARRVEGLPLRGSLAPELEPSAAASEDATGWNRFVDRLRSFASSLFRIRRTDTPTAPLLSPEESFFLYRNVELDLKSARLAVLARDPDNYAAGLEAARSALNEYFETSDEAVRSMLDAITALEQQEVDPAWPEIRRSLELLRAAGATE
jgi:uroporphyrin-III C-methyltransferase